MKPTLFSSALCCDIARALKPKNSTYYSRFSLLSDRQVVFVVPSGQIYDAKKKIMKDANWVLKWTKRGPFEPTSHRSLRRRRRRKKKKQRAQLSDRERCRSNEKSEKSEKKRTKPPIGQESAKPLPRWGQDSTTSIKIDF